MEIELRLVGLPFEPSKYNLGGIITGTLKSPIRVRGKILIMQDDEDDKKLVQTGVVRRCGPGWILTDDAIYSVAFQAAAPTAPTEYRAVLENCFENEDAIHAIVEKLFHSSDELRDYPVSRELGYAEHMSRMLVYDVKQHADFACEGEYNPEDAALAIKARLSSQAADMFRDLHSIDYRSRVVIISTEHELRPIAGEEQKINALAVFSKGRVMHCLLSELPVSAAEFCAHALQVYSMAQGRCSKASNSYRFSWAKRKRRSQSGQEVDVPVVDEVAA